MQFNSALFILAFAVFYFIYFLNAQSVQKRITFLLIFNVIFYTMLSKAGILVLTIAAVSDFFIAAKIAESKSEQTKNILKYTSISVNVGIILLFNHIFDWYQLEGKLPAVFGASFFCFRSLGYVLDVYNENIEKPEENLFHYLTYLSFFPLIMAGPISPARDFLPQLKLPFQSQLVKLKPALFLLISGIVKKYILADYLVVNFIDRVFENPHLFTGVENLFAAIAQAINVYLDFAGYTDLMMGISLLMGFEIVENFNFPYLAKNITEYWRRWHLSLSAFLNENLFFPLNFRFRQWKLYGTMLASFITFIISGFWHGTAWNYTFWGMLHGIALAWDIQSNKWRMLWKKQINEKVYSAISVLLTFLFLALSGIYFKAKIFEGPAVAASTEVSAIESADNPQTLYRGHQMMGKIFGDMQWKFFFPWLEKYPFVFLIIVDVLVIQWALSSYYERFKNWICRRRFFHLTVALFILIFIAYQIAGGEAIPFTYLDF